MGFRVQPANVCRGSGLAVLGAPGFGLQCQGLLLFWGFLAIVIV